MSDIAAYNEVAQQSQTSESLILKHISLVKRIAYHLKSRMPDNVQINDLLQSGMVGLIEASKNFRGDKGASFETFAGTRIRGAILDDIRRGNWVPRSVYQNARLISEAINALEKETKQQATPEAIAKKLEVTMEQYHQMLKDVGSMELFSLEEQVTELKPQEAEDNPFHAVERGDLKAVLGREISRLPEKEQLVLSLYYYEELNFKEIAEVLSVSESRVSQLHGQAITRVRTKLRKEVC